jgi:hypothetical protein
MPADVSIDAAPLVVADELSAFDFADAPGLLLVNLIQDPCEGEVL